MTADNKLTKKELQDVIDDLQRDHSLPKAAAAKLIGVSERTVNNWLVDARDVPEPVTNYLRLFKRLSRADQQREVARLPPELRGKDDLSKYEGMYSILLQGREPPQQTTKRQRASQVDSESWGLGCLIVFAGRVFGSDLGGVVYDGSYEVSKTQKGDVDIRLELTVPRGVTLVTGRTPKITGPELEVRFDVVLSLPPSRTVTHSLDTLYGSVDFVLTYMRGLPKDWLKFGVVGPPGAAQEQR